MKTPIKAILISVLALALCAAMLGCSLVSVDEEKDMAQIVAKVGETEITKEEFLNEFNYYISMYQQFGYDPTSSEDSLKDFQTSILDGLIGTKMQQYQAKLQGYDQFTDEQLKTLETNVTESYNSFMDMCREQAKTADATLEGDALEAEAAKLFPQLASYYYGQEMGQDELKTWLLEQYKMDDMVSRMQENFNATISLTDEELQTAFDEKLAADKEAYTQTAGDYKADQEYFERYNETPVFYAPEGYIRVKHILIAPEDELDASYDEKTAKMAELESELGALTISDEVEDTERVTAIREEYQALKAETEKLYADYFADTVSKANEAYAKLEAGETFDAVMAEYTQDTDQTTYDAFKEKGLLMSSFDSASDWSSAVKDATMALTAPGSYTAVIQDEDGCHILQYVGKEPAGERQLKDYEEMFRETTLKAKQEEEWYALVDTWIHDETIVTRFENVIQDAGVVAAE